jgi:hypothetical protein
MELTLGYIAYAQVTQCYIMVPEHNRASASGRERELMAVQPYDKNSFLSALSPSEFGLLQSHLTSFDLRVGDRLHELGTNVDHVVFPHSGLVAMTMSLRDAGLCNALYLRGESKLPHPGVKWRWARRLRIPATQNL